MGLTPREKDFAGGRFVRNPDVQRADECGLCPLVYKGPRIKVIVARNQLLPPGAGSSRSSLPTPLLPPGRSLGELFRRLSLREAEPLTAVVR